MTDTELKAKRASIKGRLTTFRNYIDEFKKLKQVSKANLNEIKLRLRKADLLFEEYDKIQTNIEVSESKVKQDGPPTSEPDFSERENTEKLFFCAISQAQELIAANEPRSSLDGGPDDDARSSRSGADAGGVRLPTIRLPSFDGSTTKWLEFRDVYISIVHNNDNLSDICKFQYLKASLLGNAASVIQSLEISAANYTAAWKLVCDRFDNKRQLIHTHLKSLFNVSLSGRETDKSLRFLIDHVSKHLRALNSLGEKTDNWDTLIIFMFASKLDTATCTKWEEYRNSLTENPTLDNFYEFLRQRADVLEMISATTASEKTDNKQINYKRMDKAQKSFVAAASDSNTSTNSNISNTRVCRVCNGDHLIYNCEKLNQMSVDERNALIKTLKVCINCFRGGHFAHQCKASPCVICKRRHNTLLHKTMTSDKQKDGGEKEFVSAPVALTVCSDTEVLLSTAIVLVKNEKTNTMHEARCFLDCGAQSNFISQALAEKLGLQGEDVDANITAIKEISFDVQKHCKFAIQARNSKKPCARVDAYILSRIMKPLPAEEVDISNIEIPQNITLADPGWYKPAEIDILVGGAIFWDLITNGKIKLGPNKPLLKNSVFGWLVVGQTMLNNNSTTTKTKTEHCGFSREIRNQLSKFWELEEVPTVPVLSPEEEACEEHFKQNTRRLADGRFCVTLPLKDQPDVLGDSYRLARKRFDSLEQRFRRQTDVKSQYVDFINEYAQLNHLSESKKPEKANFLPHHPILKEQSESTKCRVVFDASARTDSGYSLNDILMVGATVQDDIFSILIRFRQHVFIFTGDIEKMYRQVIVEPSQRHLQMILWRENEGERMKYLALNTLTYGTSSAPFLSTRCLAQLGYECSDPLIKQQRTRWQQRHSDIKPGQMVLIKDEATSPLKWPLGRIQAVYPGSDGASRVADILTAKGTIRRAINRICPFLDEDQA
ncbi:uncharacterized protein LOC125239404 [Leguminivora glycinivorella]|uniref:uncharacterized protein LOC125239404 n=1 Tax=Leguminivora glycinivorella TaxID=1035111 RepID=UPI00200F9492|nr:uncharacterized protein LOC125239404 [Leguminivora glycinivorella]